jgi:type IV pilus assembly protein PilC
MPKFSYVAKTKDARTIRDMEIAMSQADLTARLRARGLYIVSIEEVKENDKGYSSKDKKNKSLRKNVALEDLTFLSRNLAVTLSSGITLLRSLELLASQTSSLKLNKILTECGNYVRGGLSFSESITKYPDVFPMLWQSVVEVGEASGNLPFGLEKLADYLEMRSEFERKIKSAMIYPCILMSVCLAALFIFFKFILPKFTELFTQFDLELPLPTKIIFSISNAFSKYWIVGVVIIGAIFGAYTFFKDTPEFKRRFDSFVLKVPLLNNLLVLMFMERFTSTMYILLDSGLPLVYTLEASAKSIGNSVFQRGLIVVKDRVREGASLSAEIAKLESFPGLVAEMAKVGEETGTLPTVFQKISQYYRKDLSSNVERILLVFEPFMIVIMGILIGGIVISLFLPIFKLSQITG